MQQSVRLSAAPDGHHQGKLRKRLDLARDAERAIDDVPGRIVAGWVELKM
jgi:hypothetical protein